MWKTVLRLEWRILARDRAAWAVLLLFAGFLILAALAGGRRAAALEDALDRSMAQEAERLTARSNGLAGPGDAPLAARDARDPVWMGQDGAARIAVLPPAPLAPIAVGQRELHPQAVKVNTGVHITAERETETPMSGPSRLMTGAFDPAFLFVVLFPLVVIALSYELLSGERERGTLAMLLSQPLAQRALVLGKAAARALMLCSVTLGFALLGLVLAGASIAWLPIVLYALVLVAWALFWFACAILVNARGSTSARNALMLVGLWLVLVIVVPGLVHVGVDALYPPPSRIELMHEAREAARDAEKELDGLVGTHDDKSKQTGFAAKVVKVQEELARRSSPVLKELRDQLAKRQALVSKLRVLSPAIMVQLALEDIAGSGAERHHRFEAAVDDFHEEFRAFFVPKIKAGTRLTRADLDALPRFEFVEEPASDLSARVLLGVFGLLLLAAILLGFAWPALKKVGRLAA